MAVTKVGRVIKMTAASDADTGTWMIQSVQLIHTAAATATLTDAAGNEICRLATTTSVLDDQVVFPKGVVAHGLTASALSAGVLLITTM